MSRVQFHAGSAYKAPTDFGRRWGLSLGVWGAGFGVAALYLLSVTPLVKREFLTKVPLVGSYWQDKVPASDKPF